jgi:hypothetical protein
MTPWMSFFKKILDHPEPESISSFVEDMDEIDTRNKHIFWKLKAIVSRITYRLFNKFARTEFMPEEEREWSKFANAEYSQQLLDSHL